MHPPVPSRTCRLMHVACGVTVISRDAATHHHDCNIAIHASRKYIGVLRACRQTPDAHDVDCVETHQYLYHSNSVKAAGIPILVEMLYSLSR